MKLDPAPKTVAIKGTKGGQRVVAPKVKPGKYVLAPKKTKTKSELAVIKGDAGKKAQARTPLQRAEVKTIQKSQKARVTTNQAPPPKGRIVPVIKQKKQPTYLKDPFGNKSPLPKLKVEAPKPKPVSQEKPLIKLKKNERLLPKAEVKLSKPKKDRPKKGSAAAAIGLGGSVIGATGLDNVAKEVKKNVAKSKAHEEKYGASGLDKAIRKGGRAIASPAVAILNETQRPIRAIARTSDELVKGTRPDKALSKGVTEGAYHNKPASFESTLRRAGAPKWLQKTGGFALDVALDPTTYLALAAAVPTGGASVVGYGTAKKIALKATEKALAEGATKQAANKAGRRAVAQAMEKAPTNKGVKVGVRAHVPFTNKTFEKSTSGRASAAVSRGTGFSAGTTKVRNSRLVQATGKAVVHDFRPKHRTRTGHTKLRRIVGKHRAREQMEEQAIGRRGQALLDALPRKEQAAFIKKRETGDFENMTPKERQINRVLNEDFGDMRNQRHNRGLDSAKLTPQDATEAQHYVPHTLEETIRPPKGKGQGRPTKPGNQSKNRLRRKPLHVVKEEQPGEYAEHLDETVTHKARKEAEDLRLHDLWQETEKTVGRPLHKGADIKDGEFVYASTPQGPVPLTKTVGKKTVRDTDAEEAALEAGHISRGEKAAKIKAAEQKLSKAEAARRHAIKKHERASGRAEILSRNVGGTKAERLVRARTPSHAGGGHGVATAKKELDDAERAIQDAKLELRAAKSEGVAQRHVIMHGEDVDEVASRLRGGKASGELGAGYDKYTGKLKTLYTVPNPQYHARNYVGDSLNSWKGDGTVASAKDARAILGTRISRHRTERQGEQFSGTPTEGKGLLTRKPKGDRTVKIGKQEISHKQFLKEAEEDGAIGQGFIGTELEDLTGPKKGIVGSVTRGSQYREDHPRLTSYLAARRRGMSRDEAGDHVRDHHFDYSDITETEKALRRVFPFYTFWARNSRLQVTNLLKRPGKTATIGKAYDALAREAGYGSYEDFAGDLDDFEQKGLPLPFEFQGKVYPVQFGPPATDMRIVSPADFVQNATERLAFYKAAFEVAKNYSFFYDERIQPTPEDIRNKHANPKTAAPPLVKYLPGPVKDILGVAQEINPKTGKKIWVWSKKADYSVRSLPMGNIATQAMLPIRGTRGQTKGQAAIGWLTGFRPGRPTDDPQRQLTRAYKALDEIAARKQKLEAVGKDINPEVKATTFRQTSQQFEALKQAEKDINKEIESLNKKIGKPVKLKRLAPPKSLTEKLDEKVKKKQTKSLTEELTRKVEKKRYGY